MMLNEDAAPPSGALPVALLRDHLRLGSGFDVAPDAAEETALAGYLRAAIATIEARTGKILLTRRFNLRLDDWLDLEAQPLPLAPIAQVEAVEVVDTDGQVRVVEAGRYRLLPDAHRPLLVPQGAFLPNVPAGGHVTIRFQAGFGESWDKIPADLAQAVLLLAARCYEDRSFEGSAGAMPFGVSALIERWRSVRLLGGRRALRRRG